jgi:hypothetical protein
VDEVTRQVGRYQIVREIGRGGMAAVYLARQVDLDRDVALKELNAFHAADPAFAERFVRESRVAGSMSHPNIVTVFEFLNDDGTPYIAMEYLERGSLRPFVGKTTLAQTIGVLEGALAGLAQAERREIVHRDIKPENLMVTSDGEVKIADFGIAKALTEAGGPNLTATGTTVGTPAYMAPEQATGGSVGPWTDLYSVGITAYEMTVDRVPFHDSTTPVAVLMRQVSEDIPSAVTVDPSVDRRFSDWIDRLLVKDPIHRTQSAREAWYELEDIAVATLGPLWRREARLLVTGTDRAAGPLTPAPFDRQTPTPQEAGAAYETFMGDAPEAPAPPPPAPVQPAATLQGQPVQPPPPVAGPQATLAPTGAAPGETFQWPAAGSGGRGRLVLIAAIVLIAVIAAGAFVWNASRGSGSAGTTTHKQQTTTHTASLPTLAAVPAQFQQGRLQSVAPFGGHAWALDHAKPERVVDLEGSAASAVTVGDGSVNLAAGDGALWVSGNTATGGQVRKITPGGSPPIGPSITFPGPPAPARAVVSPDTIWQPVKGGLLKIPEQGGAPVRVKGIGFTPYSLELVRGSIWASDQKDKLAQVPLTTPQPQATVVSLPGAGWITGTATSVYVVSTSGVMMVDPTDPTKQTPVAGVSTPPIRIAAVGGILWTATYAPPAGGVRVGTIVGIDIAHPGGHTTNPVTFKAPSTKKQKDEYITKLVDVNSTFWLTAIGPTGESGLEPFKISSHA